MIVALEGTSLTGKSTLAHGIAESPAFAGAALIPCFFRCADGLAAWPSPIPESIDSQMQAIRYFLTLEAKRIALACDAGPVPHLILDRSVDTLLAHTWALARMGEVDTYEPCRDTVLRSHWLQPDVTLLLDARPATLAERARQRPGFPTIYYDDLFVRGFNDYFKDNALTHRRVTLDANCAREHVVQQALKELLST